MNIVPVNKSDMDACKNLSQASDEEVIENIYVLLEWVQDINWPVAPRICERLKSIGEPLAMPVREILQGSDEIWKYWVISNLLNETSIDTVCFLKSDLERIANRPTETETQEELNIVAKQVLDKCQ
jgi:hypothetical protein